jgi:hypothetical protein
MTLIKNFEKEALRLLLIKWLCKENKWAAKHMYELSLVLGKEFTTKDLPHKSSRSYELVKEWEKKGLIRVTDYTKKARRYSFTTTLFAKAIETQKLNEEVKQELLEKLDDIII